jgi:phospholipase/carboxylesterase
MLCHGSLDPVVPESLGKQSLSLLEELGFEVGYFGYSMEHAVCPEEIKDIGNWISKALCDS